MRFHSELVTVLEWRTEPGQIVLRPGIKSVLRKLMMLSNGVAVLRHHQPLSMP